mmetsp:Transcript_29161/g.90200  ORF Transcript_29161/g.90200 Transcript_29161/m.90200 type:complete len:426 (-) Transcript_29161:149-1426(-)
MAPTRITARVALLLTAAAAFSAPRRPAAPKRLARRTAALRGGKMSGDAVQLHIAGKLYPALRASLASGERLGLALRSVLDAAAFADLAVIGFLGLAGPSIVRLGRCAVWRVVKRTRDAPGWETSYAWLVARSVRRLSYMMFSLYVLDLACLGIFTIGLPIRPDIPIIVACFLYPMWAGRLASALKRRALGVAEDDGVSVADGRVLVYDRLADFGIALCVIIAVLEILSLELGVAFTSLLALSGASSVVVALACQDPLSQVIQGLLLTFNDKFRPGDEIKFGDVAGVVTAMGWFDTKIRLYSERTVVVPNSKIMAEPLVNLSRQRWGQYRTELRLRLEDADRVEATIDEIKRGLAGVPCVITRGRNLWVHWREIAKDALVLVVDVKIAYPGGSTPFYDAVQVCNGKIRDAVRGAGADFCIPTSRRI